VTKDTEDLRRIVRLTPCENVQAIYLKDGHAWGEPVVAWALMSDGETVALVAEPKLGMLEEAASQESFVCLATDLEFPEKPTDSH
jgi:hypothetical protein